MTNWAYRFCALSLLLIFSPIRAQVLLQINKDSTRVWYYSGGDEFSGNTLNTAYWDYSFGWGRSIFPNLEQQYYSEGENHVLRNGSLDLNATRKKVTKKTVDWLKDEDSLKANGKYFGQNLKEYNYTAGMIQAKQSFLYGYFEIKFRMPQKKGYWPAFWLYGCSPNEEIDMMELKTEFPDKIHLGRYSQNPKENTTGKGPFKKSWGEWVKFEGDLSSDYHIVAGEWTPEYLKYYLNGKCIAFSGISMNCPKKLVANIAVPANNGPFKPGPADSIYDSGAFEIDYIRVWTSDTSKQIKTQAGFAEPLKPLSVTQNPKIRKAIYGSKEIHKNDGLTVSVLPMAGLYEISVIGSLIPENARYELLNESGNVMQSGKLNYGTFRIQEEDGAPKQLKLIVFGRSHFVRIYRGTVSYK